jgi:hypothetical protein
MIVPFSPEVQKHALAIAEVLDEGVEGIGNYVFAV